MSRKILSSGLGILFFTMPVFVSADALSDAMDQARFLLFRVAAAQVNYDASKPNCILMTGAQKVRVREKYILAWGAWGSLDTEFRKNTWAPTGAYVMTRDTPGTFKYTFTFYGAGGAKTSCSATISVQ